MEKSVENLKNVVGEWWKVWLRRFEKVDARKAWDVGHFFEKKLRKKLYPEIN